MREAGTPPPPRHGFPALPGRLVLPGESVVVGLGSAAERAALEMAQRGNGRLVAVPPHSSSRPYRGNGTLVEIIRADPSIGAVSRAEVVGRRRVHIVSIDSSELLPHVVVVTDVAAAPPINWRQGVRLKTLIAEAVRDGGGRGLDPAGDPEEQVDRLAVRFGNMESLQVAVLNAPTLEGRLRHLTHYAAQRKAALQTPTFHRDDPVPQRWVALPAETSRSGGELT